MSPNDRTLFAFSTVFSIVMFAAVIVPYLRGKRDLFTFWNLFLFGSGIFVGFSGLNAAVGEHYYPYSKSVYTYFYVGLAAFYIPFFFCYHYLKMPRRLASKWLVKWPTFDASSLYVLMAFSLILGLGQFALSLVPSLGQMSSRVGALAPSFALAFALASWYLDRSNPIRIFILVFVIGLALWSGFSMGGGGRRLLYGTLGVIPLCLYWWKLRQLKPWKVVLLFALGFVAFVAFDQAYTAVRWETRNAKSRAAVAKTRLNLLQKTLEDFKSVRFARLGQQAVEASLISIHTHVVEVGSRSWAKVRPFYSVYVAATLPYPRKWWPEKPVALGVTLPIDCGAYVAEHRTNWGIGIVGHGYHDGGLPVIMLYAVVAAFVLRFLDELLIRHPGNPILLAFMASASGHVILWPRGMLSMISMWILACFLVMLLMRYFALLVLGAQRVQYVAANNYYRAGNR